MGGSISSQASDERDEVLSGVRITQGLLQRLQGKQPPQREQQQQPPPLLPPGGLLPPGFLPPGLPRYSQQHHHQQQQALVPRLSEIDQAADDLIREDDVIRRALEGTRRVGGMLVKGNEQEAAVVGEMAAELLAQEYTAPSREVPCQLEQQACIDCYRDNKAAPTRCASLVRGYSDCAARAFNEFATGGGGAHAQQPAAAQ